MTTQAAQPPCRAPPSILTSSSFLDSSSPPSNNKNTTSACARTLRQWGVGRGILDLLPLPVDEVQRGGGLRRPPLLLQSFDDVFAGFSFVFHIPSSARWRRGRHASLLPLLLLCASFLRLLIRGSRTTIFHLFSCALLLRSIRRTPCGHRASQPGQTLWVVESWLSVMDG